LLRGDRDADDRWVLGHEISIVLELPVALMVDVLTCPWVKWVNLMACRCQWSGIFRVHTSAPVVFVESA